MVKWEFRATQMSISIPDLVAPFFFFFLFINFGYYYVSLNLYFCQKNYNKNNYLGILKVLFDLWNRNLFI